MCRQFECGVLRQFTAGELSEPQALQLIRQARHQAARVTDLLRASGNHDEQEPLTKRYQAVMRQPIDLAAGEEAGEQRGELMLAVNGLMTLLQARFLSAGEKADQP